MDTQTAIKTGRAVYGNLVISDIDGYRHNLIKSATNNRKLRATSKQWTRGQFIGLPLYALTLEERATCDHGCQAWQKCYGNNMHRAVRFNPTGIERAFMARLERELETLNTKHTGGFSIRLHVLGDFFSVEYVEFWARMLARFDGLHIFGYTHRLGEISDAIDSAWIRYGARFNILQSDGDGTGIRPRALLETTPGAETLPVCPEQAHTGACPPNCEGDKKTHVGKVNGCLDCGLCTNPGIRGVQFLIH